MSVSLSPIAPRYAVSDADDPFKKYWWAILAGFAFTALWLLLPMMGEKSVGSVSIDTSKPKADPNVEQSVSPDDASGGGINLSMEGTGHARKEDGQLASSLFLAPDETPAPGAAATAGLGVSNGSAANSGSLASALKKVSEKSDGGWGEKAQKAFTSPKLGGGSLSGMGAASGGSAHSAGGGTSAFGSKSANVGYGATRGLSGNVADVQAPMAKGGVAMLSAISDQSLAAARNMSNDGSRSGASQAFDGAKGGSKIGNNGAALAGNYAALDAAPLNLKDADPKLNGKKIEAPPPTDMGDSKYKGNDDQLAKQIAMQVAGAVIGGVIGGPFGGIVTNAVMSALQKQMDQQDKIHEMEEQNQLNAQRRRLGLPPTASGTGG
jgi:hypothetical protein